jgi:hypothetical protein
MTMHFNENFSAIDIDILSPFIPYSIYKAAVILTRDLKDTQNLDRIRALQILKNGLDYMSKRWLAASEYKLI